MSSHKRTRETTPQPSITEDYNQARVKRTHPPRPPTRSSLQHTLVYQVLCSQRELYHERHPPSAYFLDIPCLTAGANRSTALKGQEPLEDIEKHLKDHEDISFAVCITYNCNEYHERLRDEFVSYPMPPMEEDVTSEIKPYFSILEEDKDPGTPCSESIVLSKDLEKALSMLSILESSPNRNLVDPADLVRPYLRLHYHRHHCINTPIRHGSTSQQLHLSVLYNYLEQQITPEHAEAENLFQQGLVRKPLWAWLYRPEEVVVVENNGSTLAYIVASCSIVGRDNLVLHCWSWEFNGKFFRHEEDIQVSWPSASDTISIPELRAYPLRFDTTGLEDKLRKRGHEFWTCRHRKFVSYNVPLKGIEVQIANLRYMVDMETYKLMHSDGDEDEKTWRYELDEAVMNSNEIPKEPFVLLLPATIKGFGFHNKKWSVLQVEHIRDIGWNKEAFDNRLVLEDRKKELIKALVTCHVGRKNEVHTDFMEGKGKGLIILLHGGPGTGKTLTAESVAELAERPLYRVTCGDIGTDPESVEKYLDSVLYIGTTWGCVVLLDEADVFLEERTKADLQRNALVSVFLRVLEYYDGILILTTNRIGTFDEAFKSRVQLALHYPPLDEDGRLEIWQNFLQLLKDGGENMNFTEIDKKLRFLAKKHSLNGRQIRNTINTARQLATYKKETLGYEHISRAAGVVDDFEKHVLNVHDGHDDEEYARTMGNR